MFGGSLRDVVDVVGAMCVGKLLRCVVGDFWEDERCEGRGLR